MHPRILLLSSMLFLFSMSQSGYARDFLTDKEIELIQDTQSIATRTHIYMEAAALRLKTAQDKLSSKEYEAGDPMELLTPEDVIDDYRKILRSVQLNVQYAFEAPKRKGNESAEKALQTLKEEMEKALKELDVLWKMAEEKHRETLSDRISEVTETSNDLLDDAKEKLAGLRTKNPK
jgi:hypothetical protein